MSEIGQKIIAQVRVHATAKPDFVYGDVCQYVIPDHGGRAATVGHSCYKPGCLIGQALWDLGIVGPETYADDQLNNTGIGSLHSKLGLSLDEPELAWLMEVQGNQDNSLPWGQAVKRADSLAATGSYTWPE